MIALGGDLPSNRLSHPRSCRPCQAGPSPLPTGYKVSLACPPLTVSLPLRLHVRGVFAPQQPLPWFPRNWALGKLGWGMSFFAFLEDFGAYIIETQETGTVSSKCHPIYNLATNIYCPRGHAYRTLQCGNVYRLTCTGLNSPPFHQAGVLSHPPPIISVAFLVRLNILGSIGFILCSSPSLTFIAPQNFWQSLFYFLFLVPLLFAPLFQVFQVIPLSKVSLPWLNHIKYTKRTFIKVILSHAELKYVCVYLIL